MVAKFVHSRDEASNVESHYEPSKKGLKDDPIIQILVWEYACGFRDALPFKEREPLSACTKKRLKGDPEDMDFEMSYTKVKDKDYHISDDAEDEDPKTPPHYHSDEFHDSPSEE
ncbi:hypothetical protein FNV43_RR04596 [Rhamnella rubrinervis]|uniref:Uncharacterized protein n=1 Tax=Rhamnella rubrinervis TaxID=2594499 RepID=A0A8K0HL13_9ROSA|nr:hypothetical protein FNV43_RR04596 [Rhamnella rubrinervis]